MAPPSVIARRSVFAEEGLLGGVFRLIYDSRVTILWPFQRLRLAVAVHTFSALGRHATSLLETLQFLNERRQGQCVIFKEPVTKIRGLENPDSGKIEITLKLLHGYGQFPFENST